MSCIFSAEGRSPRSRDAGRCSAGPPGPPPPFCSSRPEAAALRPPRPALGSSWGGGVGRGAQSRTRGECVSWAKGKSRQEINSCGRGTSTFSPKVDDLTLSLEPPSVLRRTRPYTDPLRRGLLIQYGGLGELRRPGPGDGKPGGTRNLRFDNLPLRLSSAISVSLTEGGAEGPAPGRRRGLDARTRRSTGCDREARPSLFGHLRCFKGRFL